jgi:tetratricopeptide (TPR) repeat protein
MGKSARLLFLSVCLVLAGAAVALADPAQDFQTAIAAIKAGDMDKAIVALNLVVEAEASLPARQLSNAYNVRGMCYEEQKKDQEALADYSKAIEVYDKSSEALGNRSLLYYKLGEMDKAKADAVAARRIDRKVKVPEFDK